MCLNIQNPKQSLHTYFKNNPDQPLLKSQRNVKNEAKMSKTLLLLKKIADLELLQINTCSRALVFLRRSSRTFLTSSRLCSTFDCAT